MLATSFLAMAGIVAVVRQAEDPKPEADASAFELESTVAKAPPPAPDAASPADADAEPAGAVEGMQASFRGGAVSPVHSTEAVGWVEPTTIEASIDVAKESADSSADLNQARESEMKFIHIMAAGAVAGVLANPASGETLFNGSAGNDWNTSANWTGGVVPGSGDAAVIGSTAPSAAVNAVARINPGATGTVASVSLGKEATSSGSLTVNNGLLRLLSSTASYVGQSGAGELTITNQAVLEGGAITVGSVKGSQGTLRIADGGVLRNPSNTLVVAAAGTGPCTSPEGRSIRLRTESQAPQPSAARLTSCSTMRPV